MFHHRIDEINLIYSVIPLPVPYREKMPTQWNSGKKIIFPRCDQYKNMGKSAAESNGKNRFNDKIARAESILKSINRPKKSPITIMNCQKRFTEWQVSQLFFNIFNTLTIRNSKHFILTNQ